MPDLYVGAYTDTYEDAYVDPFVDVFVDLYGGVTVPPDVPVPVGPPDPGPFIPAVVTVPSAVYRVTLRDASLASVGEVQWTTLDVVSRMSDVGTWMLELPTYVLPLIGPGGGVIIRRDTEVVMSGPYTAATYQRDSGHPDGALILSGVSDDTVLADRRCYPDPAHAITAQTTTVDTRTGAAETVIYAYINANAGPGALTARQVGGLTLASDMGRGVTVHAAPDTGWTLLRQVKFLADYAGLIIGVKQVGSGLVCSVGVPNDYSGIVRFSWANQNVTSIVYVATAPVATRELAHNTTVFAEVADTVAETAWGRRIENDVAGSKNDTATLTTDGNTQLVLDKPTIQLTVGALDTVTAGYGKPWRLGDLVTVLADVTEVAASVREIHFHADAAGEVITPVVGNPGATAAPTSGQALRDLIAHVNRLEGKV